MQRFTPKVASQSTLQPATRPEQRPDLTTPKPDLMVTASSLESAMQTAQVRDYPSITLKASSQQGLDSGQQALDTIASRAAGKGLLDALQSLSDKGRVTIHVGDPDTDMKNYAQRVPRETTIKKPFSYFASKRFNAEIHWNPSTSMALNPQGHPTGFDNTGDRAYVSLAHELIHAYRMVKKTYTGHKGEGADPKTPKGKEELRAVGLGKFASKAFSENRVRAEHDLPLRQSYARRAENRQFDGTARYQEQSDAEE